jgi:DNA-binding transcriptional MocR family regulator
MAERMRRGRFLLSGRLPSTCAVSSPAGGFTCWIRGPADFDSVAATEQAAKSGISLSPGPLFSVAASFRNFIGMNMSVRWDDRRERQLDAVAALLAAGRPAIAR